MKRRHLAVALALIASSCAANEDSKPNVPAPAPQEPGAAPASSDAALAPGSAALATPSIASAHLGQDCPDPKTELAAASAPDSKKAKRKSDSLDGLDGLVQPCSQSYVQLAFTGQGASTARVELKEVRLLSVDGKPLATLSARMPTIWKDGMFVAWDGMLPPGEDQKSSHKLSIPDWAALEKDSGDSSFGQIFLLEVDVAIDNAVTTLRSPQFERSRPELIKT